jgi:hypothetical protein
MKISELKAEIKAAALENQKLFPNPAVPNGTDEDSINSFFWFATKEGWDYWKKLHLSDSKELKNDVFVGPSAGKSKTTSKDKKESTDIGITEDEDPFYVWLKQSGADAYILNTAKNSKKAVSREENFERVVNETLQQIKDTLLIKGKEYRRNGDVFHNFNEGAKRTSQTPEKVLQGFALKHDVSVNDMITDLAEGINPTTAAVNEKMNDILIYNILLKAMLLNRAQ